MKRRYNRAVIIRNKTSLPILNNAIGSDDDEYWLLTSQESFHGEEDGNFFYFKDSRIPGKMKLPLNCVDLEFSKEEIEEKERDLFD